MAHLVKECVLVESSFKWWKELADAIGWKIQGFTYKHSCSFYDSANEVVTLSGTQGKDLRKFAKLAD